jgi:membrane protein
MRRGVRARYAFALTRTHAAWSADSIGGSARTVKLRRKPARAATWDAKLVERGIVLSRLAERFVRGLRAHDAFGAAATIAFWIFLSLVPLLVLVGFLVGQVARVHGVDALVGPILEIVPGTAENLVGKEIQRLAGAGSAPVAPLGVVGFLWTASSGLHNLMDVLENAVMVRRRAWWKQRAMAIGWVVVGLATACALAWVLVRTDAIVNAYDPPGAAAHDPLVARAQDVPPGAAPSSALAPRRPAERAAQARPQAQTTRPKTSFRRRVSKALHTPDEQLIAATLMLVTGTAFLAGLYRFAVEHPPGMRRRVWPGAITAILSWLLVSWAFGNYAVSIGDYALYYGSLAAVAVLLVWLYLSSLALVIGAEVNAQLEGLRDDT